MAKKRRRKSSRRRKVSMRGMGQLQGPAKTLVPVGAATALTAGTTLGLRAYLQPEPGTMSEKLYRWAPLVGAGAGILGSFALYFMGGSKKAGREAAMTGSIVALAGGGFLLASERLNAQKAGASLALGAGTGGEGTTGLGALMPEYAPRHDGLGAIVMQPLSGAGDQSPYGESVSLAGAGLGAGYNPGAFGRKSF